MQFITTPSHGYLQVTKAELGKFKPSEYSYKDSKFYYLEEDCDAVKFLIAIDKIDEARSIPEVYCEEFDEARNMLTQYQGRKLERV